MAFLPALVVALLQVVGGSASARVSWAHLHGQADTSSSVISRLSLRNSSKGVGTAFDTEKTAQSQANKTVNLLKASRKLNTSAADAVNFIHAEKAANATWGQAGNAFAVGPGIVHFLFLVNGGISHINVWNAFFARADPAAYTAFVHCKDHAACQGSGLLANPKFQLVATTPTYYCHDLVTAMVVLLRAALQTSQAGTVPEKFVFVSDSTLPVKPFSLIHNTYMADDDSDFCVFPSNQWAWANIDNHEVRLVKHHQWVGLSRTHAELMAKSWVAVDANSVWRIWLRGGSWEGKERYLSPQHFSRPASANSCTDEWAFIATIFGAVEPFGGVRQFPGFGGGLLHTSGGGSLVNQGRCRTFAYWKGADDAATSALAAQISQGMSCYPTCIANPATLHTANDDALRAIRNSPFLFMRKFSPAVYTPNYASIMFH